MLTVTADVNREVSPNDEFFPGDEDHYFDVGRSAMECIKTSLDGARLPAESITRILDLPCGHGRVLRHLRAAFPAAEITACDLLRDGVDYCAATFDAKPVYSDEDPSKVALPRDAFDLIWVGSLFTHFDSPRWPEFLTFFRGLLRPGGVLVFSAHGREVYKKSVRGDFGYGVLPLHTVGVLYGYERHGFGYANYLGSSAYGHSMSSPEWVFSQIEKVGELRIVHFSEAEWDNHQDVYACTRSPDWRVLRRIFGDKP